MSHINSLLRIADSSTTTPTSEKCIEALNTLKSMSVSSSILQEANAGLVLNQYKKKLSKHFTAEPKSLTKQNKAIYKLLDSIITNWKQMVLCIGIDLRKDINIMYMS